MGEAIKSIGAAKRVLVVDDNALNRRVLAALLEPFGFEAVFAEDGVEAVQAASASAFDLILMDMRMPRMGGLEASRLIHDAEIILGERSTPIVAVTASAIEHKPHEYAAVGIEEVVEKPIQVKALLAAVVSAIADRPRYAPGAAMAHRPRHDVSY